LIKIIELNKWDNSSTVLIRERAAYQATGFFELGRIAAAGRGKDLQFFLKEVFRMKPLTFNDTPMAGIIARTRIAGAAILVFVAVSLAINVGVATASSLTAGKMYVIGLGADTVVQANLDGTGAVGLGDLNGFPDGGVCAIAIDSVHSKMYVGSFFTTLTQANLNGTGAVDLGDLNGTSHAVCGVALDIPNGKLYVTNNGSNYNTVSQANLDGSGGVSLGNLNGTLTSPQAIALDTIHSKMYVTNVFENTLSMANLDGTGGVSLGTLNDTLSFPDGIALDVANGKMYIANNGDNTIVRANLDGTGAVSLGTLNDTLNGPWGIALDLIGGKIYVTNNGNNTVSQANLDGTDGVSLGNLGGKLSYASGIALNFSTVTPSFLQNLSLYVEILFGIGNDGGGIGILPGGGIINIPPVGPPDPIFLTLRDNMPEVLQAVELYESTLVAGVPMNNTIRQERRQALLMAIEALTKMQLSLGKALIGK